MNYRDAQKTELAKAARKAADAYRVTKHCGDKQARKNALEAYRKAERAWLESEMEAELTRLDG